MLHIFDNSHVLVTHQEAAISILVGDDGLQGIGDTWRSILNHGSEILRR